jgi:hypothetical protein
MTSEPTKPGFAPGKPAVYTPHSGKPVSADEITRAPDEQPEANPNDTPPANPHVKLDDSALPVDLTTGKAVSSNDDDDTREMSAAEIEVLGLGRGRREGAAREAEEEKRRRGEWEKRRGGFGVAR